MPATARSHDFSRKRRWIVGSAVLGAVAAGAIWVARRPPAVSIARNPNQNVLLITIDTLRSDALGCYSGAARTPNIDAFAARAARFSFAHAHAVVTLPSHASILTGKYPFQHGIRHNSGFRLMPGTNTMATLLKAGGYATAAFVGGFPLDSRFGLNPGFDVYDDRLVGSNSIVDFSLPERPGEAVVTAAREWLTAQKGRWFLWVHLYDPHAPYRPPAPFDVQYRARPYFGEVSYADAVLQPLLEEARRSDRPTLTIITADHGEGLGDHGEMTHGLFAYETTLHVPLIIGRLTDTDPGDRSIVVDAPVRHVDLLPTVLDAADVPVPAGLPGHSLLPVIGGRNRDENVASYFEAMSESITSDWAPLQGVLAGREKYIELPIPELYDLSTDPHEEANLANRQQDRQRVLVAQLRGFNAPLARPGFAEDAEVVGRLRALGYVSASVQPKTHYTEADDPKTLMDLDRQIHHGIELFESGRTGEAIAVYRRVLEQRPSMGSPSSHLAFLYWEIGDVATAIQTLRLALHNGAADPQLTAQLGIYLAESGEANEAIPLLEALPRGAGFDFDTVNALGIAYARAGRPDKAVATFTTLLEQDAVNATALQNLGSVYLQQGRFDAANDVLRKSIALDDRSAPAHTALGAVQLKLGHADDAIAEWRRAAELDPKDFDALFNLTATLLDRGNARDARPYLERFVKEAPPARYRLDIMRFQRVLAGMNRSARTGRE